MLWLAAYLMVAQIDMVHIHERDSIAILIVVDGKSQLIKSQLHIEPRYLASLSRIGGDLIITMIIGIFSNT